MKYRNADQLVRKLSALDKIEASRELTRFYTHARFRISKDDFRRQFTDGANDGGIDFFNTEDSTHFVFQSKFPELPKGWPRARFSTRWRKLKNALAGENPNRSAMNSLTVLARAGMARRFSKWFGSQLMLWSRRWGRGPKGPRRLAQGESMGNWGRFRCY